MACDPSPWWAFLVFAPLALAVLLRERDEALLCP